MGKMITREQVEEVSELVKHWVAENLEPDSGVAVITAEKCKDGTSKVVASCTAVKSSSVTWEDLPSFLDKEPYMQLKAYGMEHPVTLETKPESVNLSHMWQAFETRNYITQQAREDIETAVATNNKMPCELWVVLPGTNCVMGIPEDYPRSFLETVFLAHVYDHLSGVVQAGEAPSFLKTKGVNRPEITGLSKVPRVVRAGDMETVPDVLNAVALELITRGVKIGDSYQHNKLELAAQKVTNHYWK